MKRFAGKYQEQLLELNLHLLTLVFSWMKWKPVFLKPERLQPFIWLRYIDATFFIWTHGAEQLKLFLKDLNEFNPNLKFTYETFQNSGNFLYPNVSFSLVYI